MRVFISWSGRQSELLAKGLADWLPQVVQAAEPWISVELEKGARWSPEIAAQLEECKIGILCVTRANLVAPWLIFEAGALSKPKNGYVCSLLLNVKHSDVTGPLSQFQHTAATQEDVWKLVSTINKTASEVEKRHVKEAHLRKTFDALWPELEKLIESACASGDVASAPARHDGDVLREVLETVRATHRMVATSTARAPFGTWPPNQRPVMQGNPLMRSAQGQKSLTTAQQWEGLLKVLQLLAEQLKNPPKVAANDNTADPPKEPQKS